jgi:hypothetical protein
MSDIGVWSETLTGREGPLLAGSGRLQISSSGRKLIQHHLLTTQSKKTAASLITQPLHPFFLNNLFK